MANDYLYTTMTGRYLADNLFQTNRPFGFRNTANAGNVKKL